MENFRIFGIVNYSYLNISELDLKNAINQIQDTINSKIMLGEFCDEPSININIHSCTHIVEKSEFIDSDIVATIKILDTREGRIVKSIIKDFNKWSFKDKLKIYLTTFLNKFKLTKLANKIHITKDISITELPLKFSLRCTGIVMDNKILDFKIISIDLKHSSNI